MALQSKLFRGDAALEACLVRDSAHVVPGAVGNHVCKIQTALGLMHGAAIDLEEVASMTYGPNTAAAVLDYKQKRDIVNRSYQTTADNIVGRMTIAALDRDMVRKESAAPHVVPVLLLAFGVKPPPVPETASFRIRTVRLDRPGPSESNWRFRIYQIVDTEHRLTAFYFRGDPLSLFILRSSFRSLKAIDKGALSDFRTKVPTTVTAFTAPCTETITKTQPGWWVRERVSLSWPSFQPGGLNVSMEGLHDENPGMSTIVAPGPLHLIEQEPRQIPR
jgi:hypothetical protein